jgi:O-antigen/teichoic acid export membrane protein
LPAASLKRDFLRALSGSTWVYIAGTALAFLVGVQLARGLGVAGYGFYGSAMAAASLGATVASGGLQLHATRDLSAYLARADRAGAARLIGWSYRHVTMLGMLSALAAGAYVLWGLAGSSPMLAAATMAATALMALFTVTGAILRGAGRVVLGQALDTAVRPAALSALLWGAVLLSGAITSALAMGLTVAAILIALPASWPTLARLWRVADRSAPSPAERRGWRSASATMGLTTILNAAEASLPLILVGALTTIEQAGLFRVAAAVMVFTNLPATMLSFIAPPMASAMHERGDRQGLAQLALAGAGATLIPSLAIAGCLWIFGDSLLALAFGSDYRAASGILSVLTGASVAGSMAGISISLLHAGRHDAAVTRACAVALGVTCIGLAVAALDGRAVTFAAALVAGAVARTLVLALSTRRLMGIDPTLLALPGWLAMRQGG